MALTRAQAAVLLKNLGWRVDTNGRLIQAAKDFQRGWNLGAALSVDGLVGPHTSAALLKSEARRRAGLGTASSHFSYREFSCKCGGRYATCRRIWIARAQVQNMERYRTHVGHPVAIVSGCRCCEWNRVVGGAAQSRHMTGDACDFAPLVNHSSVQGWGIFGGIGYGGKSGLVCHGDARPVHTTWVYSSW